MSAAVSTEGRSADAGGALRDAAAGRLPAWAEVSPWRRAHVARVAALMEAWADALALPPEEKARWTAAAWLHDALRDADPRRLRAQVPEAFRALPDKLLHGPAAAERLAGAADAELLDAVRYHTVGSPRFGLLGRALYLADFMEPGRDLDPPWTHALRARMPHEMDAVLREVVEARVAHVLESQSDIHPETRAFHDAVRGS
jgi:HD superfamily phosphohydrolase YqeK